VKKIIACGSLLCLSIALTGLPTAVRATESFRLMQWPKAAPEPRFDLIDVDRRRRSAADFRGRVTVVFFGFTHCPDVCPGELFKMARVFKRLGSTASQVRVLFITLDPERDTPELLKSYVAFFDPHFVGLTGSTADINAAAGSFSVQFAKVPQGDDYTVDHSTGTYVLDKTGHLRLAGTTQTSIDDWVHDLRMLAAARP